MTKVLFITGASQGIGKSTVALFHEQGWQCINLSRHSCDIAGVTNVVVDFCQTDWLAPVTATLQQIAATAQQISLVHNAAQYYNDSIQSIDAQQFHQSIAINLLAPILLNQLLLPMMQPGSSILYIGSTLSEQGVKNAATYTITKHGLVGLMRASCQDLDHQKIHTCCICPGFTDTQMLREHVGQDADTLKAIAQYMTYDKRLIMPEEIAQVVWFCANHPVMNGEVIHANLGQVAI